MIFTANRLRLALMIALLCILSLATGNARAMDRHTLRHDDIQREFWVQEAQNDGTRHPLILLLHGGTRDVDSMLRNSRFEAVARRNNAVLIAPQAYNNLWNDQRTIYYTGATPDTDDVGFLAKLIDFAVTNYGVDPDKVLVTGASNGGMMTYRMMCERPDKLTAAAPIIATMLIEPETYCPPQRKLPLMMMTGTADPLVPYRGGTATSQGVTAEPRLPAMATAEYWAKYNGCSTAVQTSGLKDRNERDDSTVEVTRFMGCPDHNKVVLYTIRGGGHTLPTYFPRLGALLAEAILGETNRDIDLAETVWSFFEETVLDQ